MRMCTPLQLAAASNKINHIIKISPDTSSILVMAISSSSSSNCQRKTPAATGLWWFTFICAALLYFLSCQRGVSWQDSGMFQWRVLNSDVTGDLGLALAHPLYIAAGKLFVCFPWGDMPMRLNFLSGIGMAVALANLAVVLFMLTGKRWIGFIIAAQLAFAHTVWWLATIAEVYTLSLAGLSTELLLLLLLIRKPRWFFLAALSFVSGLGLSIHNLALLPLPVYGMVALFLIKRKRLPIWSAVAALFCYLTGAAPYLILVAVSAFHTGNIWNTVQSALFGRYAAEVLNLTSLSASFKVNAVLIALNFINTLPPLAVLGWIAFRKRIGHMLATALGAITLIELIFAVRYNVPDQFTFFLPSLFMIAVAAGIGLRVLSDTSRAWRNAAITACIVAIIIQPLFYAVIPRLVEASGIAVNRARVLPFRDEVRYWLVPWKHTEHSAELFVAAALKQATPNGIILADGTSLYPILVAQQLRSLAPSVAVQFNGYPLPGYSDDPLLFRERLGNHRLYVVSPVPGYIDPRLIEDADFTRGVNEVLYQVRWKH